MNGKRRQTILTGFRQRTLEGAGREEFEQPREPGYWSKEKFEERFVKNTLIQLLLYDESEKLIGREPKTFHDLREVLEADSKRPGAAVRDINAFLTEKINQATRFLGLKKER